MNDITSLTLAETILGLEQKKLSEQELNKAYLARIKDLNSALNVFLEVENNSSKIPVAVKDIISTKNLQSTGGSKILNTYIPPFNATVVEKILEHGASVIGKTNNDEFAMGSSGENSAFGATKNPWDITKVPGGSSSGSAAAIAADLAVFSLGTDTGGSIRQPASFCGVVGLKPSYGRVSRYGIMAMASSLDCPGVFTKTVADARLVLEWIQGVDNLDSNCVASLPPLRKDPQMINGLKIGVPKEYFGQGLDGEVEKVIKQAISKLEQLGAKLIEVSLPHTQYAIATYYIIMASEVSSNLARFDGIRFGGVREDFGEEVKRRIMLGTFSLSSGFYDAYFTKAAKVRSLIRKDFNEAFGDCDVIVGPVSPTPAWDLGAKISDPLAMYLMDVYTVPPSLAGLPGLSVPCGFVPSTNPQSKLPVGLQILGKYLDDELVLNIGEVFENATDWQKEKPKL